MLQPTAQSTPPVQTPTPALNPPPVPTPDTKSSLTTICEYLLGMIREIISWIYTRCTSANAPSLENRVTDQTPAALPTFEALKVERPELAAIFQNSGKARVKLHYSINSGNTAAVQGRFIDSTSGALAESNCVVLYEGIRKQYLLHKDNVNFKYNVRITFNSAAAPTQNPVEFLMKNFDEASSAPTTATANPPLQTTPPPPPPQPTRATPTATPTPTPTPTPATSTPFSLEQYLEQQLALAASKSAPKNPTPAPTTENRPLESLAARSKDQKNN